MVTVGACKSVPETTKNTNYEKLETTDYIEDEYSDIYDERQYMAEQEKALLEQIEQSLEVCKSQIAQVDSDVVSNALVSVVATQLATLKFNCASLSLVKNKTTLNDIDKCIEDLNKTVTVITNKAQSQQNAKVKAYNSWALNVIESVNTRVPGIFASNKAEKEIELLLEMEKIQINYLYLSISNLYHQVYSEIWNKLDSEKRFLLSKRALNVVKKEL
ncbi:MAG: hypothetical protein P1P64_06755 [Treponemataceae bacterium]